MLHKPVGFLQAKVDVEIMRTDLLVRDSDVKTRLFYDFQKEYFFNTFTTPQHSMAIDDHRNVRKLASERSTYF